jgi:phage gp29-like protein
MRNGSEDQELTEKFKAPWFEDWLSIIIDHTMWGYTLVEAGQFINEGFENFSIFPRRHVEPFKKHILLRPGDITGIPYGDNPAALFLIELGQAKDLGRFKIVAREVIWKNFSRSDWSQASEKFGMPFLHFKTATDDKDELDRIEALCRNFASNGYIISSNEDEVTIHQPVNSDFYKIFHENAQFCDQQISKCINGQTGTSDEKSFVGAAEVHERILDDFSERRLRTASNLTNTKLIPFLNYHGWGLEGVKFCFPFLDKKTSIDQVLDPDADPEDTSKKKVRSALILPDWVLSMPEA